MRDPLDPPSYDEREDDFDADDIASADSFDGLEIASVKFYDYAFNDDGSTIYMRLEVSAEDAERALPFRGGRGILTLEKAR